VPLPEFPLSSVCRAIATFVSDQLQASQNHIHVRIGSPANAVPSETDTEHRINLFFYRFEPGGFGPAASPGEAWLLRLHCLVTAFGVQEEQVSAGENDLRLLGGVLRAFHERPVLDPLPVNGQVVRTQVVFQPLSADELNHIWSTQGEVAYRPSVAYEMALVPVLPRQLTPGGPLVGAVGFEVHATEAGRRAPFGGVAAPPAVPLTTIDTGVADWAPRIAFVHGGRAAESLAFAVGSPELAAFVPRVWIAGEKDSPVSLSWQIWDSAEGWRPQGDPVAAAASGPVLDPDQAASATTEPLDLPFTDRAGQAVVSASRVFTRVGDGASLTVRSNPLLVNLFEVSP
jgi:hypothetical protein